MQLIIERVTVTNKSWFYLFARTKLRFFFGKTELEIVPATDDLNRVVDYIEPMRLVMLNGDSRTERVFAVPSGSCGVTIEDSQFSFRFQVRRVDTAWGFLDSTIGPACQYHGQPYYVNDRTLESSFDRHFHSSQSSFPSFRQCCVGERLFFADTINKIVIPLHPAAKQKAVKEVLRRVVRGGSSQFGTSRLVVDRDSLLQSGASALLRSLPRLRLSLPIFSFKNEIGEDYGAIRREFFYLVTQQVLADPRLSCTDSLYDVSPDYTYTPSCPYDPAYARDAVMDVLQETDNVSDSRVFFLFLGALLGSVILFNETVDANFSLAFYENLLGGTPTLRHVQDVEFQRSLLRCTRDPSIGYTPTDIEDAVHTKLLSGKTNQYGYIRLGFLSIFPDGLTGLTAFDFPFIFYHFEPISILKLMRHIRYDRCSPATREIRWLWEILTTKSQAYLSKFLLFFTGSGTFPRFDEEMRLTIEKVETTSLLLTASSCANRLFIGSYSSKQEMEYFMDYSISNTVGFHKV